MTFALGVVIFVLGLLVSIGVHEIGHMVPAKRFGVKVPEYSIGFGPTLWRFTRGETTYAFKAIPLGGYVRLAGMLPQRAGPPRRDRHGRLTVGEEARDDAWSELAPGEENRAFASLSAPKKFIVMFGGPLMNWLFAGVILAIVFAGLGVPTLTSQLSNVQDCVSADECAEPDGPAALAGLQAGDRVLAWNGVPVADWDALSEAIRAGGTETVPVLIERHGQELTLSVTPAMMERPVFDDAGEPVTENGAVVTADVPYVGISPAFELQRQGLGPVPGALWDTTTATFSVLVALPVQLWNTVQSLAGLETGQDRSVISIVGVGQMAGSITSMENAEYTLAMRAVDMISLLASLNLALFAFNLIPLLPLDGGHLAGSAWEGARRTWARLRGRPDPGPVDLAPMIKWANVVFGLLAVMAVILIWADIAAPIGG